MNTAILYDLINLAALAAIVAGVCSRFGWESGAIVGGGVAIILNVLNTTR